MYRHNFYNCATYNFGFAGHNTDQPRPINSSSEYNIVTEKKKHNIWDQCTRNALLLRIMMIICQREERQIKKNNNLKDMWTRNQPNFNWNYGSDRICCVWYENYFNLFNCKISQNTITFHLCSDWNIIVW